MPIAPNPMAETSSPLPRMRVCTVVSFIGRCNRRYRPRARPREALALPARGFQPLTQNEGPGAATAGPLARPRRERRSTPPTQARQEVLDFQLPVVPQDGAPEDEISP